MGSGTFFQVFFGTEPNTSSRMLAARFRLDGIDVRIDGIETILSKSRTPEAVCSSCCVTINDTVPSSYPCGLYYCGLILRIPQTSPIPLTLIGWSDLASRVVVCRPTRAPKQARNYVHRLTHQ